MCCVCAFVHKNSRTNKKTSIQCKSCSKARARRKTPLNEVCEGDGATKHFTILFIGKREMCIGSLRVVKIFFRLVVVLCHWNYYEYENSFYVRVDFAHFAGARNFFFINQFNFPLPNRDQKTKMSNKFVALCCFFLPPTQLTRIKLWLELKKYLLTLKKNSISLFWWFVTKQQQQKLVNFYEPFSGSLPAFDELWRTFTRQFSRLFNTLRHFGMV